MFFIIGTRPRTTELRMLTMVCWSCRQPAAHRVSQKKNHVTLFFIPLIPLRATVTLQCLLCGADQELSAEQANEILDLPRPSTPHIQQDGVH